MGSELTEDELAELERLHEAAYCAPWTYEDWAIDCPAIGSGDECGYEHNVATVTSPDEYPDGQVVAQIDVPGLKVFADRNGALIVAARNALPKLIAEVRRLREERDTAAARDRARIVAWLRSDVPYLQSSLEIEWAADAIERGEHATPRAAASPTAPSSAPRE